MTSPVQTAKRSPTVLIADDDPGILRFLAKRCTKMGFEVQTVANGLQALIIVHRNHPDVLIMDINMPEADGLSVCSQLKQSEKKYSPDLIVITANPDPEMFRQCQSLGACYVRKGIDLWNGVRAALIAIFPEQTQAGADEETSQPSVEWERPRVLLIDGNREAGRLLTSRLDKCGVETLLAFDSTQGFEIACREEPSVIILDFPMLKGDPYFLLSRLRSTPTTTKIPVFVTTTRIVDEVTKANLMRDVCAWPGTTLFFVKSFNSKEILMALQRYCAFVVKPFETNENSAQKWSHR
jgi:CheY-like chemotaxis protein